jgi:hypothetical protein
MKTPLMSLVAGLAVLGSALSPLSAQDANPESAGPPSPPTADEAARMAAAREKAKNDPTVRSLQQARESLDQQIQNAMNAAMLAADPGLASSLKKVGESRERAQKMRQRFESLTPEQREQLKKARKAAQQDPAVQAAREKMKAAETPEARREAGKAMHEAMMSAMTKQNPELAPILKELGPGWGRHHDRMGRPDGPGGPRGPMPPPENP